MMPRAALVLFVLLILSISSITAQTDDSPLTVDAGESFGAISPYIYGANHGPWASFDMSLIPTLQTSGITYLRYPGGRWGDENNIRPEQLDLFMMLVRQLNVEPSISVRLENGTPEQAAELVQYTLDKAYNVRYWSIGNEPNLFKDYTVEQNITEWRAIAEAMLAVDPDILLLGPEISQYPPSDSDYHVPLRDWVAEFLKANGDLVDIVTIHRYPFPAGQQQTTIEDLRRNTVQWDFIIEDLREVVRESAGRDIPVAITEFNSHWSNSIGGEAGLDSFYNAIWMADSLGRMIKHQIEIAAMFTLATPGNAGGWGLLNRYDPRPSFYIYPMYSRFGTELVASESADPDVTIYAALTESGDLTLMVINLGPDEAQKPLSLANFDVGGDADVWRFDIDHQAENIGTEALVDGVTLTIPPQSVTLYIIPAAS